MRVGIVSQFAYENLGNKLQNYALQQWLMQFTETVITIKNKSQYAGVLDWIKYASFISDSLIIHQLFGKKRLSAFLKFHKRWLRDSRKKYYLYKNYNTIHATDRCDLYCAGSDQIWKPTSGRCGPIHYLTFAEYDRTFSYAASFGIDRIPEEHQDTVRRGLQHIKFLSVREDAGKRIVEELTGRTDVQVHVDPTLLLTPEKWDAVAEKPKQAIPEKYILTYFLGVVSPERREALENKARELGCGIVALMDKNGPYYNNGPSEFLWLMKHAHLVCTDSFHGSVFSFLYGKPLVIFDRKGSGEDMSSRLKTLADRFELHSCMASGDAMPEIDLKPDYSRGYKALEKERERSKAYFDMVFQEAERLGLCE